MAGGVRRSYMGNAERTLLEWQFAGLPEARAAARRLDAVIGVDRISVAPTKLRSGERCIPMSSAFVLRTRVRAVRCARTAARGLRHAGTPLKRRSRACRQRR